MLAPKDPVLLDGPSPPLMNQGPSAPLHATVPDDVYRDIRFVDDKRRTRTWNVSRHVAIDWFEANAVPLVKMSTASAVTAAAVPKIACSRLVRRWRRAAWLVPLRLFIVRSLFHGRVRRSLDRGRSAVLELRWLCTRARRGIVGRGFGSEPRWPRRRGQSSDSAVLVSVRNTFTLRVTDSIGVARTAPVRGGSHLRSAGGAQAQ
jgi:hypothetical protein